MLRRLSAYIYMLLRNRSCLCNVTSGGECRLANRIRAVKSLDNENRGVLFLNAFELKQ